MYHMKEKYGTVCRLPSILGRPPIVFTFDPTLSQKIYRLEGTWPGRQGHQVFEHYRKKLRPEIFKDMGGLISDQGEAWHKLRTMVNPVMMQPSSIKSYLEPVDAVAREFVHKIGKIRDENSEMPDNFSTEMGAWALESIGVIALDRRLGALEFKRNSDVEQLIQVR